MTDRVGDNLNHALHELFTAEPNLLMLGEDVLDDYGGAFKISRGLSSRYPDRVLATPLSENGIVGVANGLALCGNKVIVEVMFGDFLLLALDQLVNFAAKSVTMFGRPMPMPVLVRCPVGGQRGYGATHSQSVQKFVVGVPELELWELSPFVDAGYLLHRAFARGRPAVLFEDKVLYTKRMFEHGVVDAEWSYQNTSTDPRWTVVRHREPAGAPDLVIVAAGGLVHRCLDAAGQLRAQHGITAELLVPTRLHPCDPAPVLEHIAAAGRAVLVEEGTPDGSWTTTLAQRLHTELWGRLHAPVSIVTSRDSIIPAATHLEQRVLVSAQDVLAAAVAVQARTPSTGVLPMPPAAGISVPAAAEVSVAAEVPAAAAPVWPAATPWSLETAPDSSVPAADSVPEPVATPVAVPRLNSNDESAVLLEWLVPDGASVAEGEAIAVLETSKSAADLEAPASGVLSQHAAIGAEYDFGAVIGIIEAAVPTVQVQPTMPIVPAEPVQPTVQVQPTTPAAPVQPTAPPESTLPAGLPISTPPGRRRTRSVQQAVASAVTASHRAIPPAFACTEMPVEAALDYLDRLAERDGVPLDLGPLILAAIAALHPQHRELFAAVSPDGTAAASSAAHLAVTIDAGTGLFLPVVRAGSKTLGELADRLIELQMAAVTGELTDADLDLREVGLGVSLNLGSGVDLVQPLIMPGLSGMVSVGAVRQAVRPGADGQPAVVRVLMLGITHDHRVVNGAPAMRFLTELAELLQRPDTVLPD